MARELTRADFPWPRFLERWRWPEMVFAPEDLEMKVEEFVEGDQMVVRAEMPGLDPDKDVDIQIVDGALRIRAERREEKEEKEKGRYRSEFRYGSFTRTVPLGADVDEKDVKASYKDGILEVRLPVDREKAAAKKIPVQRTE